ncbi:hypothetical protein N9R43_01075 [bacterium]|nr:hypothetical protein [bacterium]
MSKIQTVRISKDGVAWDSSTECLNELKVAISSAGIENDLPEQIATRPDSETTFDGVTLVQVYEWHFDDEYDTYKAGIAAYEEELNLALADLGWTITDTVTD